MFDLNEKSKFFSDKIKSWWENEKWEVCIGIGNWELAATLILI